MARTSGPYTVQCYHCRHRFEVGGRAQSTSCPACNQPVIVGDVTVKKLHGPVKELRTCGRVYVARRGRILSELIEAHAGIECYGVIESRHVICGNVVQLGAKCRFKGDLQSPAVSMKSGARVQGGFFRIPDDPARVADLYGHEKAEG